MKFYFCCNSISYFFFGDGFKLENSFGGDFSNEDVVEGFTDINTSVFVVVIAEVSYGRRDLVIDFNSVDNEVLANMIFKGGRGG